MAELMADAEEPAGTVEPHCVHEVEAAIAGEPTRDQSAARLASMIPDHACAWAVAGIIKSNKSKSGSDRGRVIIKSSLALQPSAVVRVCRKLRETENLTYVNRFDSITVRGENAGAFSLAPVNHGRGRSITKACWCEPAQHRARLPSITDPSHTVPAPHCSTYSVDLGLRQSLLVR